jgi:hypothetical protein
LFDEAFIGKWIDQDSAYWSVEQYKKKVRFMGPESLYQSFKVTISEKGKQNDFHVHMFSLGGDTYLDFIPFIEDRCNSDIYTVHIFPTHSLAKFYKQSDSLLYVKWFNQEWLKSLFEQKRIKIAHEIVNEDTYILTADTDELHKFILKYGNDPNAFKSIWEALPEDQENESFTMMLRRADAVSH